MLSPCIVACTPAREIYIFIFFWPYHRPGQQKSAKTVGHTAIHGWAKKRDFGTGHQTIMRVLRGPDELKSSMFHQIMIDGIRILRYCMSRDVHEGKRISSNKLGAKVELMQSWCETIIGKMSAGPSMFQVK